MQVFRSITVKVAVVAASAAVSALAAALAVVWSLNLAENQIEAALQAQRRLDLWSVVSGQISDYTFTAIDAATREGAGARRLEPARDAALNAFAAIERAVTDSIAAADSDAEKAAAANRGRLLARLRAGFEVLDRQIGDRIATRSPEAADQIRGALNGFAVTFAPNLSAIMDDERRTATRIREETGALRTRLTAGAAVAVVLALLLAAWLYRAVARPLVSRIGEMGALAAAIGRGDLRARIAIRGRDEMSLAMAGFNRMAARLERKEARVAADVARLEQIVQDRTADLRRANEQLAALDATRRRFFTDVSHELRTPLTVILGECDLMRRRLERDPDNPAAEAIQTIRNRAQKLHRRVEDLLRIARSDSGEIDLHSAEVRLSDIVAAAVEDAGRLARRAGMGLETDVPPDLGVLADPDWIRQVLEGLIANAVRHSTEGSRIAIGARAETDSVVLTVADQGTGIPAEDLPHVFERFYRGGDTDAGTGFGIGLSLAKWVIDRHRGTISIGAGTTGGTVVTIRLPAADVANEGRA
jgi:two-component system OmpR family sensor kinase